MAGGVSIRCRRTGAIKPYALQGAQKDSAGRGVGLRMAEGDPIIDLDEVIDVVDLDAVIDAVDLDEVVDEDAADDDLPLFGISN